MQLYDLGFFIFCGGLLRGTGRIFFFLSVSLLLHGVWFLFSPQGPGPRPVTAPLEIGLRPLPRETVSAPAAPPARPVPAVPTGQPATAQRPAAKGSAMAPAGPLPVASPPMQPATPANAAATAAGEGSTAADLGETAAANPPAAATSATASPAGGAQEAAALIEAVPLAGENPPPLYPRLARQRGWEGLVALRVRVSAAGEVLEAWVEQSSGHGVLDQAALNAVQSWRFRPAREGVRAVAGVARVPIEFRLRGG